MAARQQQQQQQQQRRAVDAPDASGETGDVVPRFQQQVMGLRIDGGELQQREPSSSIPVAADFMVDATPVVAAASPSVSDEKVTLHLQTERLQAELELERQRVANRQRQQQHRGVDVPEQETDDIPRGREDGGELHQQQEPSSIPVAAFSVDATPVVAATSPPVSDEERQRQQKKGWKLSWKWNKGRAWRVRAVPWMFPEIMRAAERSPAPAVPNTDGLIRQ